MSFTSPALLKDIFGESAVTSFENTKPGVLGKLIEAADSIITTESGLQPPANPEQQGLNSQVLVYAAWIVRYLMIEHQGIENKDELDIRGRNYDRAIKALRELRGSATSSTSEKAKPQYVSTARVGEIL